MAAKPEQREDHESAQIGDLIYLFGGWDGENYFPCSEIHVFDIRRQTWDLRIAGGSNIPPNCRGARCVVIDGLIYCYGGFSEEYQLLRSDVYRLDPKTMEWEELVVSWSQGVKLEGRHWHCLCAVGSRIIMLGGMTIGDDFNLYELKLIGQKKGMWVEVKPRGRGPGKRWGAAMIAVDDHRAFIHGGLGPDYQYLDSCFVLNLEKKEWSAIAFSQQPSARAYHTLCHLEGTNHILLNGGRGNEGMSDHGCILDLEKRRAYKMERAEPIEGHTAHCVQKSDKTIRVILLGGKDSLTHVLKSIVNIRVARISQHYTRMKSVSASVQPSALVSADLEGSKDQMIQLLQEDNVELRERCVYLEYQVSHFETQVSELTNELHTLSHQLDEKSREFNEMRRQRSRFEQQVDGMEAELLHNDQIREVLANECQTLEASLAEGQRSLDEFLSVLSIKQEKLELTDQKLGSGSFADVCIGRLHGMPVAVKKFHQLITTPRTRELFHREVLISSRFHHPNIVTVCGAVMEEGVPFQMVAELLEGSASELMDAAHASGCYLTGYEQLSIALETTSAISYLHQLSPQPYVHSDIRPTNLLVARDMKVKLGDLGAAHLLESSKSAGPLSPQYLAPERMPRADGTASRSSLESDVYSLGVTMIEIFTGVAAIPEQKNTQLRRMTDRRQLRQFCSRMISVRASERPSAQECLSAFAAEKELIRPRVKRLVKGRFKAGVHVVRVSDNYYSC